MSTTTWFDPARSTSSIARRSAPSTRCSALLDDERLAEDARGLGQRHRQAPLEVGALGQRRVVVGVTELVRQRLRRVGAARPVHQHQRAIADERHAERAADLAVAWSGVDPPLVEGAGRPARRAGRCSRRTRRARSPRLRPNSASPGRPGTGRRDPTTADPLADRRRGASALARIQRRKSGNASRDRRLHRVERRPADGVGEQRGVERVVPLAPAVDDRRLTLDRVDRRGAGHGDLGPGGQLGGVGGTTDRGIAVVGEPAHRRHRQSLSSAAGSCTSAVSCDVTSRCRLVHAVEPTVVSSA